MPDFGKMLSQQPFGMPQHEKEQWYCALQKELTLYHYMRCKPYQKIIDRLAEKPREDWSLPDIPMVPVRLFKSIDLKSTGDSEVARVLTSSGTSGRAASRIHLDRKAILLQSRVLKHIFSQLFPKSTNTIMFVVERPSSLNSKNDISASVAAIRGFSQFAKDIQAILDESDNPDLDRLENFIAENPDNPFIIFGFTSQLWFQLISKLQARGMSFKKNKGIVIHGGGWKKMQDKAVSKAEFNQVTKSVLGVTSVHNYYGMVEQTGSVFIECEEGYFHPSIYSEVIIRDQNLQVAKIGEKGLIQVMTVLAESYPGHNLLTDDIGMINGEDFCKCGRRGKFFSVLGRAPGVELRGCSDAK